jgi:hypothetical protein
MAEDVKAAQHFQRSLSRRGVEAAVALARTDPAVVAHADQLDAVPDLLCTPGGVVDLRSGDCGRPSRDELHTRSTPFAPEFSMPTPRWDQFLADTFPDDPELIGYVQRLAGYCHRRRRRPRAAVPVRAERAERQERAPGGHRHAAGRLRRHRARHVPDPGARPARDRDRPARGAAVRGVLGDREGRPVRRGQGQDADRRGHPDRPVHAQGPLLVGAHAQALADGQRPARGGVGWQQLLPPAAADRLQPPGARRQEDRRAGQDHVRRGRARHPGLDHRGAVATTPAAWPSRPASRPPPPSTRPTRTTWGASSPTG